MDGDWLGKFFSWQLAAWSAFLLNVAALFKLRNERKRDLHAEKESEWDRYLEELDRIRTERDAERKENRELRAALIECERISLERLGRAVIAESTLIAHDKVKERPTILPGANEP